MIIRWLWLLAVAATFAGAETAQAANRFAFVVGNDTYQNVDPLRKAVNDARSIAQAVQTIGFQVTLGENLTRRQFIERFSAFENRIQPGDTAFLFYSGHGVELDGANYLIPVDAPRVAADQQSLLKDESISTDNMIQRLKARGSLAQIVVLDACRENPFRQTNGRAIGGSRGLAPTQAPGGVFVIYSAGVGEVALDRLSDGDTNPNSVFTRSFLPLLTDPAQSLVTVAKETRSRVKALATTIGMTQSPAYYDEIDGELFLAKGATGAPPLAVAPANIPPALAPPMAQKNYPAPVAAMPPPSAPAAGFIFADSDRVRISPAMLRALTPGQLRLARNEIYARRGRFFRDPALAEYFSRFAWYRPYAWDVPLNAVEQANVSLIGSMER
ncbi:MAG: caspase family protein [Bradyrhizobium sp.]